MASGLERHFDYALRAFAPELPTPECEFAAIPGRKYRFDRAWPFPIGLLVEINGGTWVTRSGHAGGVAVDKDYWKVDAAVALGYRVMMFSSSMLRRDPRQCVELVKAALSVDMQSGKPGR